MNKFSILTVFTTLFLFSFQWSFGQVIKPFAVRYQVTQKGGIVFLANSAVSCNANPPFAGGACQTGTSQNPPSGSYINNSYNATYVDIDGSSGTFQSSSDSLNLNACSQISWAGLYWGGNGTATQGNANVKLKVNNNSYQTIVADEKLTNTTGYVSYHNFKNITNIVKAAGTNARFTVADIPMDGIGTSNKWANWLIVVVYGNELETMKQLTVFDGLSNVSSSPVNVTISGFLTPPTGPVNFEIGNFTHDGDRGSTGDQMLWLGTSLSYININNGLNPSNDVMNGTVSNKGVLSPYRIPNLNNSAALDADIFAPNNATKNFLNNSQTSATFRLTTGGDVYLTQTLTTAIDVFEPDVRVDKKVFDSQGNSAYMATINPGDTLTYFITYKNIGSDTSINSFISDTLDENCTYVPNSMAIVSGPNAGAKSDAAGDDQATYFSANNTLRFNVGLNATAASGGKVSYSPTGADSTTVRFKVVASGDCYLLKCDNQINNTARAHFTGKISGNSYIVGSNPAAFDSFGCPVSGSTSTFINVAAVTCTYPGDTSVQFCSNNIPAFNQFLAQAEYNQYFDDLFQSVSSPTMSGTYHAIRTAYPGCTDTIDIFVIIENAANAGIDIADTICSNHPGLDLNTILSGAQAGGTWNRLSGTGGAFNNTSGLFEPLNSSGSSAFRYIVDANAPCTPDTSIVSIYLNQPSASTTNVSVCSNFLPYAWNSNNYSTAGTYTFSTTNAAGCDSIATLVLSVAPNDSTIFADTVCTHDLPYSWNGNFYSVAGSYFYTSLNTQGCDSVSELLLSVTPSNTPQINPYPNANVCLGQNIELQVNTSASATIQWTTPAGFNGSINQPAPGHSVLSIDELQPAQNGLYTVTLSGIDCALPATFDLQAGQKPNINFISTSCVSNNGQISVNASGNNLEYAVNGGAFQSSPVLSSAPGSLFVVAVREQNGSCINFYDGQCVYCPGSLGCSAKPKDSLVSPSEVCGNAAINLSNYFQNANTVDFISSGTGVFSQMNCNSSPCSFTYTPSATDLQNGYVILTAATDDPDGTGPCQASLASRRVNLLNGLVAPSITTSSPACENGEFTFSHNSPVGQSNWLGSNGFTSSQSSDTIANVPATMHGILQLTLSGSGCNSVTAQENVVVVAPPNLNVNLTPNHELCLGSGNGSIDITVSGGSGSYEICSSPAMNNCVSGTTATFNWLAPGTYTITVKDLACPSSIFTYNTTLNSGNTVALPVVPAQIVACAGENLTLSGTAPGTINWTFPGNNFNALGNTVVRYNAQTSMSGLYQAKQIDNNGCASAPVGVNVVVEEAPLIQHVQVNCVSGSSVISVTASCSSPMTYSFDGINFQSSPNFNGLAGGNYTLQVKNTATDCINRLPITVPNCACPNEPLVNISHPLISCGLNPITLDATFTNVSNATWSSNGSGIFSVNSGNSPLSTTYTPSATELSNGEVELILSTNDPDGAGPCTAVQKIVNIPLVSSLSPITITRNQASYCSGDTLSLSVNTLLPIQWNGPGGFVSNENPFNIIPATPGISGMYTASLIGNGCVSQSASELIAVASAPVINVSAQAIDEHCFGQGNGQIIVSATGGSSQYIFCNDFALNCQSAASPYAFKWLSPGTYNIHVSDATCPNHFNIIPVTLQSGMQVAPATSATYNQPVCIGEDLILSASGDPGGEYIWNHVVSGFTANGDTVTRAAANNNMSGIYEVRRTEDGCASLPLEVDVNIFNFPQILSVDTSCHGGDSGRVSIQVMPVSGVTYEYALNDGPYQLSNVFEYLSNGLYQVHVRPLGSDCAETVSNIEMYCSCYCNKEAVVSIYPNPNTGQFTLKADLFETVDDISLEIYNLQGQRLYTEYLNADRLNIKADINISQFASGVYRLRLKIGIDVFEMPLTVQ